MSWWYGTTGGLGGVVTYETTSGYGQLGNNSTAGSGQLQSGAAIAMQQEAAMRQMRAMYDEFIKDYVEKMAKQQEIRDATYKAEQASIFCDADEFTIG
jgi:hypothetical protein